ncbi:hypothetical protein TRAPUB_4580 [Trametes pubescens]|uniref:Uncharacterized protein n=1 Tax=Trametes pubescens TaxID=154538 RepID=A0A1M2VB45_TRAPU|nr:hypothetical protein TRAPUB_4580 [Trametes pubescens]
MDPQPSSASEAVVRRKERPWLPGLAKPSRLGQKMAMFDESVEPDDGAAGTERWGGLLRH